MDEFLLIAELVCMVCDSFMSPSELVNSHDLIQYKTIGVHNIIMLIGITKYPLQPFSKKINSSNCGPPMPT